jgi:hypothetical protein
MVDPKHFMKALKGKKISRVWRGYGSALFVEFGTLTPFKERDGKEGNLDGELTLMIEWSWRFERKYSILGGSWSSEKKWPGMFKIIIGTTVIDLEFFGHLPEISVLLSNGLRIVSFMTAEGQPEWAIIARKPDLGILCVRRGKLYIEPPCS